MKNEQMVITEAAKGFLSQRRIAVAGASRKGDTAGNLIYKKLRQEGYATFAVNPNADQIEGDPAYQHLADIPGGVEAVVVATHPSVSASVVEECADLGIKWIWLHRSFGQGSVSDEAIATARRAGMNVIPGACPMMYCDPVDVGHKCMRWWFGLTGKLPKSTA
jgi:predicted CoA-binding protein